MSYTSKRGGLEDALRHVDPAFIRELKESGEFRSDPHAFVSKTLYEPVKCHRRTHIDEASQKILGTDIDTALHTLKTLQDKHGGLEPTHGGLDIKTSPYTLLAIILMAIISMCVLIDNIKRLNEIISENNRKKNTNNKLFDDIMELPINRGRIPGNMEEYEWNVFYEEQTEDFYEEMNKLVDNGSLSQGEYTNKKFKKYITDRRNKMNNEMDVKKVFRIEDEIYNISFIYPKKIKEAREQNSSRPGFFYLNYT